jgi:curli biogenesis system outer membrane secretion channel CsgG
VSFKQSFIGFVVIVLACFSGCASEQKVKNEVRTVAVWDLVNYNQPGTVASDLGELLAARVIETLEDSRAYQVIERERLIDVLEELNLGTSPIVEESTRLKIGQIVGARYMVFGSYFVVADTIRIDLRLVEVETGNILKATQKMTSSTNVFEWLNIAREAARDLI